MDVSRLQPAVFSGHGEKIEQERLLVGVIPAACGQDCFRPGTGAGNPVSFEKIGSQPESGRGLPERSGFEEAQGGPLLLGQPDSRSRDVKEG